MVATSVVPKDRLEEYRKRKILYFCYKTIYVFISLCCYQSLYPGAEPRSTLECWENLHRQQPNFPLAFHKQEAWGYKSDRDCNVLWPRPHQEKVGVEICGDPGYLFCGLSITSCSQKHRGGRKGRNFCGIS